MNITVTALGPCRKKIEIEVPVERVREEFDKNYKEIAGGVNIPGFRKGRVPRAVLRKRYAERIAGQVKSALLQEMMKSVIDDHDIEPVSDPDCDFEALECSEESPFLLEMELEVRPDFELPDVKAIEVEGVKLELDEAQVQKTIESLRKQKAELVPVDGKEIADGDHVIVDVKVTHGEDEILADENVPLLVRAGNEIPTWQIPYDAFVGKKVGEDITGSATLPDSFHDKERAGQEVNYALHIQAHQRPELPELDEDFFGEFEVDSLEALKEQVRKSLEHQLHHEAQDQVEERLLDAVVAKTDFDIPESVIEAENKRMVQLEELELRRSGATPEEISEKIAAAQSERDESVQKKIRRSFVIDRIAKAEGESLDVSEEEIENRIKMLAQANRMWPNEMRERLEQSGAIDQLVTDIRSRKVRRFLRENATITGDHTESCDTCEE